MSWDWVDYHCYEWLYYNNPGRHLVGALIEDGRIRTKWDDAPPDKPVLTELAKQIVAEIKAAEPQPVVPIEQRVVSYTMQKTLEILEHKTKPRKERAAPTERKKKVIVDTTTPKLFDD